MNKVSSLILVCIVCALGLVLLGCNEQKTTDTESFKVKFAHAVNADTPKGKAAEFFAKRVYDLSKGKIKVEIFPNAQLVDDDRIVQELTRNNIQMAAPSFSKLTSIAKDFNVWDIPFLFRNVDHVHKVMDGEIGQMLKNTISQKGLVALDYWDCGFKQFSSSKQAILLPDDIKGQKVRIMNSKVLEEQISNFGGTPVVINFAESYQALLQKMADAAENPLTNFYASKLYEVQDSITLSNHGYLGYLVIVSDGFWRTLPDDLKTIFEQALNETKEFERKQSEKEEKKLLTQLLAQSKANKGIKVITLKTNEQAIWKQSMGSLYPQFYNIVDKGLVEQIQGIK